MEIIFKPSLLFYNLRRASIYYEITDLLVFIYIKAYKLFNYLAQDLLQILTKVSISNTLKKYFKFKLILKFNFLTQKKTSIINYPDLFLFISFNIFFILFIIL